MVVAAAAAAVVVLLLFLDFAVSALEINDLHSKTLGFVGCGKIGSAVARGYCLGPSCRPKRVVVSPRTTAKAQQLCDDHPDIVEVAASNAAVVAASDVVFLGLLPGTARTELPTLPFRADQLVISMMAAVDLEEVLTLVRTVPRARVVRTVPLPSNARRSGPILLHPAGNAEAEAVLSVIGQPVVCATESEMKPLVSLTGHISSFFELQRQTQAWAVGQVRLPRPPGHGFSISRRLKAAPCPLPLALDACSSSLTIIPRTRPRTRAWKQTPQGPTWPHFTAASRPPRRARPRPWRSCATKPPRRAASTSSRRRFWPRARTTLSTSSLCSTSSTASTAAGRSHEAKSALRTCRHSCRYVVDNK